MQIDIGYPRWSTRSVNADRNNRLNEGQAPPGDDAAELIAGQTLIRRHSRGRSEVEAILKLVRSGRPDEGGLTECDRHIAWGPGPAPVRP